MEFLRELYALIEPEKKKKKKSSVGTIIPIGGFMAGGSGDCDVSESAKKVVVAAPKPRNKQLHDTLSGTKGGRMADKKKDYKRSDKHKGKMFESDDRWSWCGEYEQKDHSGEGRDRMVDVDGIVRAASAEEAKKKALASRKGLMNVTVSKYDPSTDKDD